MRRTIASLALTASVGAGLVGGALIGTPGVSFGEAGGSGVEPAPAAAPGTPGDVERAERRSGPLDEVLAGLVADGTLTQAQADAVRDGVAERHQARKAERREHRQDQAAALAGVLGISTEALRSELQAGRSLADIARERGVDVAAVVEVLARPHLERIDAAVAEGRLTAEQAERRKAMVAEKVGHHVEEGPRHHGRRGHRGPGARSGAAPTQAA